MCMRVCTWKVYVVCARTMNQRQRNIFRRIKVTEKAHPRNGVRRFLTGFEARLTMSRSRGPTTWLSVWTQACSERRIPLARSRKNQSNQKTAMWTGAAPDFAPTIYCQFLSSANQSANNQNKCTRGVDSKVNKILEDLDYIHIWCGII